MQKLVWLYVALFVPLGALAQNAPSSNTWIVEGTITGLKGDLIRIERRNKQQVILKTTPRMAVKIDEFTDAKQDALQKGQTVRVTYRMDTGEIQAIDIFAKRAITISKEGPVAANSSAKLPPGLTRAEIAAVQKHKLGVNTSKPEGNEVAEIAKATSSNGKVVIPIMAQGHFLEAVDLEKIGIAIRTDKKTGEITVVGMFCLATLKGDDLDLCYLVYNKDGVAVGGEQILPSLVRDEKTQAIFYFPPDLYFKANEPCTVKSIKLYNKRLR